MNRFFKINDILIRESEIRVIDCSDLENLRIKVNFFGGGYAELKGLDAIDIVMRASPHMIEGKRFKFSKYMWIIHNMIGHPLMQILALLRLYKWAMLVHDRTIPKPKGI